LIYDYVKDFQTATIVRNAVKIDDYPLTECAYLKVAVVGPFLPGTQNYDALELFHYCVKQLPMVSFEFIGPFSDDFKNSLSFSNVNFLGKVEKYIETLSGCSILLSPYPDHSHIIASKTKILEAGACQMPVVTSETGALGFPDEFLQIAKSKNDFIKKIEYLQDDKARKQIGCKLRSEIIRNYNSDIEVTKLLKLYKEFLK